MIEMDGIPFRLMRFRYGVGVLFVLLEEGPLHMNAIRKKLGAEYPPIHNALEFMVNAQLVGTQDARNSDQIKCEYVLTPVGRQYAERLSKTAKDLQALSSRDST